MSTFLMSLISMTITASIIIVVVMAIRILLKKAPKVFSYVLWIIVLIRLLCPISIPTSFSIFNLLNISTNDVGELVYFETSSNADGMDVPENGESSGINSSRVEQQDTYYSEETGAGSVSQNHPIQYTNTDAPNTGAYIGGQDFENEIIEYDSLYEGYAADITEKTDGMNEVQTEEPKHNRAKIVFIIWVAGAGILFAVNMFSLIGVRRKIAASIRLKDNIYLCDDISTPFCLGIIRPRIYLPSSLEKHERKYIYLHEKHHIKRLDHVVKCVAFLALCIHWFNPLVWLAFILSEKDMEMSCDEAVMRQMNDDVRKEYSYSLLRLAAGKKIFIPSNLAFGDGNTKARIKNVMNYKKPVFWVAVVAVIACVCLALVLGTNPKRDAVIDTEVADNTLSVNDGGLDITTDMVNDESGEIRTDRPTKDEVIAMRELVLEGMSQDEIDRLTENIKVANLQMERAYLYDDLFGKLEDKDSPYWQYFDMVGEIQLGWWYNRVIVPAETIMRWENITEEEVYANYEPGTEYNRFDAENFIELIRDMLATVHNDALVKDMQRLIDLAQLAKDTHEMEYANEIYKILHDMDYFLLRYGPEDAGIYTEDMGIVGTYYGVLNVYKFL